MKYGIRSIGVGGACCVTLWGSLALAEEPPSGLMQSKAASSGTESVATAGFETQNRADAAEKDATQLKFAAGGFATGGNSRSLAGTASGKLRLRRSENQLVAAAAANYGRSRAPEADSWATTVENYQGKLRYDRFITGQFSLFLATSALRDRFQGLNLRMNVDPGAAYYFIDAPKQQLWGELGYDLQHDVRRRATLEAALLETGVALDRTETRHSGRVFAGYLNTLTPTLTLDTGVEYLQALKETKNYRIDWAVALTSALGKSFSIATAFGLKYDHNPLPGIKTTDWTTSVSLVYQLL